MAVAAAYPQEPVCQATAGQVVLKLTLHVGRQRAGARGQLRQQRRVVCFNALIQERLFGAVACVVRRAPSLIEKRKALCHGFRISLKLTRHVLCEI